MSLSGRHAQPCMCCTISAVCVSKKTVQGVCLFQESVIHSLHGTDDRLVITLLQGANVDQHLVHIAPSRVPQQAPLHNARYSNVLLQRLQIFAFLELNGVLLQTLVRSIENFTSLVDCLCNRIQCVNEIPSYPLAAAITLHWYRSTCRL